MPPRLPLVLVFFAIYFAVLVGGEAEALLKFHNVPLPAILSDLLGAPQIRLTLAEAIGATAALFVVPDAALRPTRDMLDRVISALVATAAIAVGLTTPEVASVGYAGLTALAIGDAAAALLSRRNSVV